MNWKYFRLKVHSLEGETGGPGPGGSGIGDLGFGGEGGEFGGQDPGDFGGMGPDPGEGEGGFLSGIADAIEEAFSGALHGLEAMFSAPQNLTPAQEDIQTALLSDMMMTGINLSNEDLMGVIDSIVMSDPDTYGPSIFGFNPLSMPAKVAGMLGPQAAQVLAGNLAFTLGLTDRGPLSAIMTGAQALGLEGVSALDMTAKATASQVTPVIAESLGVPADEAQAHAEDVFGVADPAPPGEFGDFGNVASLGPFDGSEFAGAFPDSFESPATPTSGFGPKKSLSMSASPRDTLYASMTLEDRKKRNLKELEGIMVPLEMLVNELSV